MGRLAFPKLLQPGTPLYTLMRELHDLHGRAGHPSLDEIVKLQAYGREVPGRFHRDAVYRMFTKTSREVPPFPLLWQVVGVLAEMDPMTMSSDVEGSQRHFHDLWFAADRYVGLQLPGQQARDDSEPECAPGIEAWGDQDE